MDILNNHEHYNKFTVLNGVRIARSQAVTAYRAECALKRIFWEHGTDKVLRELTDLKNSQSKMRYPLIKRSTIIDRIELFKGNALQIHIDCFHKEGILSCLAGVIGIKKHLVKAK
jgi:hypothetical protein